MYTSKPDSSYESTVSAVRAVLGPVPEIESVFLFGSILTAYFNADSDIDVAVLCSRPLGSMRLFDLSSELSLAMHREVDIVEITPDCSLVLQDEVARKGRPIVDKNPSRTLQFQITAPQMLTDFQMQRAELERHFVSTKVQQS